jgi:YHS domain-containing protein
MNSKKKQFSTVLLLASLLLVALNVLNGCGKSEPAATTEAKDAVADAILQKTCPVMGGVINKNIFVEYKDKKVYFCCAGCETKFNNEPEKYLAKLPQFSE